MVIAAEAMKGLQPFAMHTRLRSLLAIRAVHGRLLGRKRTVRPLRKGLDRINKQN